MANMFVNYDQTDFLRVSGARDDQTFQPPRINQLDRSEVQA